MDIDLLSNPSTKYRSLDNVDDVGSTFEQELSETREVENSEVSSDSSINGEENETRDIDVPISENNKRAAGKPKLVRTGKPGRPKKQYPVASVAMDTLDEDPEMIEDVLIIRPDKERWLDAMKTEYNSLLEYNTWELVNRKPDKRIISSRRVFHIKRFQNGEIDRYKARLVARGCEQKYGVDYLEIYSPVARIQTIRTFLALSVEMEYHVHQMDVITAYIQGNLSETIYMEQPPMFINNKDKICRLKRPIYGISKTIWPCLAT